MHLLCLLASLAFSHSANAHPTEAWSLAVSALQHNVVPVDGPEGTENLEIVLAGAHQFRTSWSWDFAFASEGLLGIGRERAVRDTLASFFERRRADGLLPRVLDSLPIELRVVLGLTRIARGFKGPLKPWYVSENKAVSPIPNLTLVAAASRYVQASHDAAFARRWYPVARSAVAFVEREWGEDGIIARQQPFSDWEDSVRREGRVAFTNLLYVRALQAIGEWAAYLGEAEQARQDALAAEFTLGRVLEVFWDESRGVLRNYVGDDTRLTADANLFAVANRMLTGARAGRAMGVLRASPLWLPMPGRPTWPEYPGSMKSFFVTIGGMRDYHDRLYWPWITALAARAERALGNCADYERIMAQLDRLFVEHDEVGEVYRLTARGGLAPVKRLLYRSEAPFTWASGMYIEAAADGCRAPR
ncbi:MAG: hypothetical protein IT285_07550 [Bdellovibrionales bacterium]|nr:hypothetical protein [Bdellovibrionales bacterium]